jgi:hypothetical protein
MIISGIPSNESFRESQLATAGVHAYHKAFSKMFPEGK